MSAAMSGAERPRFRFLPPRVLSNRDAALDMAELGFPVFPAQSRLHGEPKRPMPGIKWSADATTDFEAIEAAWGAEPDAAVGMPVPPGFVVVDADGPEGVRQWRDLWAPHGGLPDLPHVLTPSGGAHYPFRLPKGVEHGNGLGSLRPKRDGGKIDIRGGGKGYVIAQGSDMGDGCAIYCAVNSDCPFLDAPELPNWLLHTLKGSRHEAAQEAAQPVLTPQPQSPAPVAGPAQAASVASAPSRRDIRDHPRATAWAERAFEAEVQLVATTGEGGRNAQLNNSAMALGQLVAGGWLDQSRVQSALIEAARACGLDKDPAGMKGVLATIRSGMAKGLSEPRDLPDPIRREIEADADFADAGRRAAAPALARAPDGTLHDAETGEVVDEPLLAARSGIQLTRFADIEPVIDANDFVQGLLVDNSVALAYGDSNVGKSFWATDLALHVAAGLEWNGRRVERGGVLYAALEGGAGFKNRVAAWRAAHAVDGTVHFAAITAPLNLRESKDVRVLAEAVEEAGKSFGYPVKLLVIDTVSRGMAGGDENSSADMGAFVRGIDRLREVTGAAILLVHHSGKDASKGARGHSLLRAAVDTEIEITADEATGYRTAHATKQRDLAKGVAISFRLDVVELGQNRHGEPVTTCCVVPGDQNSLYVNDRGKRAKPLPGDQEALLRAIKSLIIDAGVMGRPASGMPEVRHVSRQALQAKLMANGWLCPPGTKIKLTEQLPGELPGSGSAGSEIPDSEHKRLYKRLESLQNKGKIGFTRDHVWLV